MLSDGSRFRRGALPESASRESRSIHDITRAARNLSPTSTPNGKDPPTYAPNYSVIVQSRIPPRTNSQSSSGDGTPYLNSNNSVPPSHSSRTISSTMHICHPPPSVSVLCSSTEMSGSSTPGVKGNHCALHEGHSAVRVQILLRRLRLCMWWYLQPMFPLPLIARAGL
jgi:hypothetical protein